MIRHNDGHQYTHANTKTTIRHDPYYKTTENPSWSWSYGSWIYNYMCNQCLSQL